MKSTFAVSMKKLLALAVGLALAGGPPALAQTLPHHGTAASVNTLWWITQLGSGPAGEFEINNASNASPALVATTDGSGPALAAIATGSGDGLEGFGSSNGNGNGVYGHGFNSGSGGYFIAQNSGDGVYGQSTSGNGVRGSSFNGYGVYGNNINSGNFGVVGGRSYGITGQGHNHAGVYAYSDTNNGIFAQSGSGYAGYFNGNVYVTGTINGPSDARYKTHVTTLPNALATVLRLRGVSFHWRQAEFPAMRFDKGRHMGFIAQEMEKVLPEIVSTDKRGYRSVDYLHVVPLLVEAIKQQQQQIEALRGEARQVKAILGENTRLKARLADQEARLTRLENAQTTRQRASQSAMDGTGLSALGLLSVGSGGGFLVRYLRRKRS